jgi:DNA-binding MarR family transcriptional regulator
MAKTGYTELELELTRLLRRARTSQQRTAADVHPDLDSAGYVLMVTVRDLQEHDGSARAADIAETLGLHKSTMSRNLAHLEELGLIERVQDPADARARQVRLTPAGAASLAAATEGRRARLRGQLEKWEEEDIAQLARLLHRLNDHI